MNKIISFIFGILVYLLFLMSFLYAIGFVGNLLVPKSIDSGVENALAPSILINLALLSIFAVQHSVMARPAFKKWWIKIVGKTIERSIYVLSSSLALIFLYWQWRPIKTVVWEIDNATISAILIGLYFFGWLIVLLSTFMINHFELFGLKQIFDNLKNISAKSPAFQINFFYKIVRHPIMLGFLIAFWSTPVMTVGHLIFTVTTTFYIIVAVKYLEEKDLIKHIGEPYEIYQKKVPMFIPFSKSSN